MKTDKITAEHEADGQITRIVVMEPDRYRFLDIERGEWNRDSFEAEQPDKSITLQHRDDGKMIINGIEISNYQRKMIIDFMKGKI